MRVALTILAVIALGGCKQHGAAAGPGDAPAEILPGSASDAMIAYDTLRSQPPLAPPTQDAPGNAGVRGPADDGTDAAAEPSAAAALPPAAAETAAPPKG